MKSAGHRYTSACMLSTTTVLCTTPQAASVLWHLFGTIPVVFCLCNDSFSVLFSLRERISFLSVLSLADMELTLPIAPPIVLCFALVARIVLITHPCIGSC